MSGDLASVRDNLPLLKANPDSQFTWHGVQVLMEKRTGPAAARRREDYLGLAKYKELKHPPSVSNYTCCEICHSSFLVSLLLLTRSR